MKELLDIANRWGFDSVIERLRELDTNAEITIGFLGDFSAGKSTLINELVGHEGLMPAKVEPCTKSAGLVIAKSDISGPEYFRQHTDGTLSDSDRIDFVDITQGTIEGRPVVFLPATASFPEGVTFADTPGLASIREGDSDITYSELPFFDAAILCVDIQKGGLTSSIVDFLQSPGVRHLRHRFLIALTQADKVSAADREEIRDATAAHLARILSSTADEARSKVLVVSAGPQAKSRDVEELRKAVNDVFLSRKNAIAQERKIRVAERLVPELIALLSDRRKALFASTDELAARLSELDEAMSELAKERSEHGRRLDDFAIALEEEIRAAVEHSRLELAAATDDAAVHAACLNLAERANNAARRSVGEFGDAFDERLNVDDGSLRAELRSANKIIGGAKTLATAFAVAAIMPNAAAGAASKGAASAGRGAAILGTDLGQAAVGAGGRAVVSRMAAGGKSEKAQGRVKGFLTQIGQALEGINPINIAGDFLGDRYKRGAIDSVLRDYARNVSNQARNILEQLYEDRYFGEIDARIQDLKENINAARKERTKERDSQRQLVAALENDYAALLSRSIDNA